MRGSHYCLGPEGGKSSACPKTRQVSMGGVKGAEQRQAGAILQRALLTTAESLGLSFAAVEAFGGM